MFLNAKTITLLPLLHNFLTRIVCCSSEFWKNERFDSLLDMATAETDFSKKYEMLGEMQQLISDQGGSLTPVTGGYLDAHSSKLKGFGKNPLGAFGGMEWPEYIWMDS